MAAMLSLPVPSTSESEWPCSALLRADHHGMQLPTGPAAYPYDVPFDLFTLIFFPPFIY